MPAIKKENIVQQVWWPFCLGQVNPCVSLQAPQPEEKETRHWQCKENIWRKENIYHSCLQPHHHHL